MAKTVAIIVAAGVVPSLVFVLVYRHTIDIPFWDEWASTPLILAIHLGHVPWSSIWARHNEHRVIVPELIFLALNRVGSWSEVRETLFCVGIVTLNLAILWRIVAATIAKSAAAYVFLAVSLLTFSQVQCEDFFWAAAGFGWFIPNVFAILALYILTAGELPVWRVVLGFVSCLLAVFSEAPGLSTLLVGFLILLVRCPLRWRLGLAWLIASLVVVGVYLSGSDPHDSPSSFRLHDLATLQAYPAYVLTYLGSPLGSWQGIELSEALGGFAILFFLAACFRYARIRLSGETGLRYLPWLALCAFTIVDACLTAYGRVGLGLGQALASRYTAITSDMWCGIIAILALFFLDFIIWKKPNKALFRTAAVAFACMFGYLYMKVQFAGYNGMISFTSRIDEGRIAVSRLPNASDTELSLTFPDANSLRTYVAQLKQANIGFR